MKKSTINNSKSFYKNKIFLLSAVVILVLSSLIVLEKKDMINFYGDKKSEFLQDQPNSSSEPDTNIDYSPANPTDNTTTNQQKESNTGQPVPEVSSSIASIVLNRASTSNDVINFRSSVYGIKSGNCNASLINKNNPAQTLSKNGSIAFQDASNNYVCNIDIPNNDTLSGEFTAYATIESGGKTIKSNELTLNL